MHSRSKAAQISRLVPHQLCQIPHDLSLLQSDEHAGAEPNVFDAMGFAIMADSRPPTNMLSSSAREHRLQNAQKTNLVCCGTSV